MQNIKNDVMEHISLYMKECVVLVERGECIAVITDYIVMFRCDTSITVVTQENVIQFG